MSISERLISFHASGTGGTKLKNLSLLHFLPTGIGIYRAIVFKELYFCIFFQCFGCCCVFVNVGHAHPYYLSIYNFFVPFPIIVNSFGVPACDLVIIAIGKV